MGKNKYKESVNSKLSLVMNSGKASLFLKSTMKAFRNDNSKAIFQTINL